MANRILIPNGGEAVEAEYNEQVIKEYKNNPFIECLPPILQQEEVAERLSAYPSYDSQERILDKQYRIHYIQKVFRLFQPLSIHLDLESRISRLLRQSYLSRNPLRKAFAQSLQEGYQTILGQSDLFSMDKGIETTGSALTVIGISGSGKSTAINHILSQYPQIVVHKNYKELNFSMYQVVWLKMDVSFDGSIKGFCIEFFLKIDQLLGTNYYQKFGSGRKTIDNMLAVMAQITKNVGLGLLVIDEIQHLSKARSGNDQFLLNFLVTLINKVSLPVILIGTPKALSILQGDFRQARRGSGIQGNIIWERLQKDQNWDLLINALWPYQWTKNETKLTKDLSDLLYEESQGICDVLIKLYAMTQAEAIIDGSEVVTAQLIKKVANTHLSLIKPMISALKSGDIREIAKYEDIYTVDADFFGFMDRERASVDLQMKIEALKRTQQKKEQEVKLSNKEQAILKLIELKVEGEIAQAAVEKVIGEKDGLDVNEVVIKAIQSISTSDKPEKKHRKVEVTVGNDLRIIVAEGRKENKTAYEILKAKDFIKSYEDDFSKVG